MSTRPAPKLLTTRQMAEFAARGCLALPAVVPDALNARFLADIEAPAAEGAPNLREHYQAMMRTSTIPLVSPGTPFANTYPAGSALDAITKVPEVAGAIASLVGTECRFDHHFLHVTFPKRYYERIGIAHAAQHTHQDSTIDPRRAFDLQIMYFPHEVTREMGGTRYVPGTHLRIVSESAIARYQNLRGQEHVVCPAGSILLMHHGIWHGGGYNASESLRYMFKIRLCPTAPQVRLWDTSDLAATGDGNSRPIFWQDPAQQSDPVQAHLTRPERWFEADTGRLEYLNRIRFWRYLTGNEAYDADYWLTRVENEHG